MADLNGDEQHQEEEEQTDKLKQKKHDLTGAKDLEKVTDYAEESELLASDISNVSFSCVFHSNLLHFLNLSLKYVTYI